MFSSCVLIFIPLAFGHAWKLTPIVNIESGPIQGKSTQFNGTEVYQFLGVPFAQPPLGKLRFLKPVKHIGWKAPLAATEYGKPCFQRGLTIKTNMSSEDCLFLNLFVTEKTFNQNIVKPTKRPVMVWIHGGALQWGSGNEFYDGMPIVPLHDIILITFNHRLNAFGFMYFGEMEPRIPGNMGFWDQISVLEWIQQNIQKFGGDPDRVTIFGVSSGAWACTAHVLSPASKGLFHRAIIESGSMYLPAEDYNLVEENSKEVLNRTSCIGSKDILGCLQGLDPQEIIDNQSDGKLRFTWIYGDEFLPTPPEKSFSEHRYNDQVDLLIGIEPDEFSWFAPLVDPKIFDPINPGNLSYNRALELMSLLFVNESMDYFSKLYFGTGTNLSSEFLRAQLLKALSDYNYDCPLFMFAFNFMNSSSHPGRVYAYYHTQKPVHSFLPGCDTSPWMGICHGSEVPHVFGFPLRIKTPGYYSDDDVKLSLEIMRLWTHFAETGKMPPVGGRAWETWQENVEHGSNLTAMVLNANKLGEIDTEEIKFCVEQWPHFLKFAHTKLLALLGKV